MAVPAPILREPLDSGPLLQLRGFDVGAYDFSQPLVIDPVMLRYSTYLGGDSKATGVAVDAAGNAYVAGTTSSASFPVTPTRRERNREARLTMDED